MRFIFVLFPCLLLAACGSDNGPQPTNSLPPRPAAPTANLTGDICSYKPRKDPIVVAHRDAKGAAWRGDIKAADNASFENKWSFLKARVVASAVAAPRVSQYRARISDDCYDKASKKYYSCSKVVVADVSKVRSLGRAPTMEQALKLALEACERIVRKRVSEKLSIRQEGYDLKCRIIERARCPLPKAGK